MKASLTNLRISPRKVRLVTDLVKGKSVPDALAQLQFLTKRSALPIAKLINSAVANAVQNSKADKDLLFIQDIRVDKGAVLKRMMPRAFGRGAQIKKRNSHLEVTLGTKAGTKK
jgi:large subunit ribosomal protein L22